MNNRPIPKRAHLKDDILEALNDRERAMLEFIVDYIQDNPLHQAPSHEKVLEHFAKHGPKRADGKPAVYSKQQTYRVAERLRSMGLLLKVINAHYNMVPEEDVMRLFVRLRKKETVNK